MVLVLLAALGVIDTRPHSAIGYNVPDCDAKSQWRNQPFSVANTPRNFNVRQSKLGPKQGSGDMQRFTGKQSHPSSPLWVTLFGRTAVSRLVPKKIQKRRVERLRGLDVDDMATM